MLGTLSTHTAPPAARRVDPMVALRGASGPPEAGAPPRQAAPDTAMPEQVAGALAAVARSRAEPGSVFAALARGETGAPPRKGRAPTPAGASAPTPAGAPAPASAGAAAPASAGAPAPASGVGAVVATPALAASAAAAAAGPSAAAVPGAALLALRRGGLPSTAGEATVAAAAVQAGAPPTPEAPARAADPLQSGLSEEELAAVAELAQRDREVREHEMAHVTAGRPWAGPAVYLYQTGPDGRRYAVGGFAPIDVSPIEGNPEATAAKMRIVIESALAAQPPSPADRHVAALAQARLQAALAAISEASRMARQGDVVGAEEARAAVSARV
ncbi:putative metalloprotease CJM1_0395 family protein [Albimonas pacifica]|uniref:SprA-related family protein n=1 Tax=Albimonas pacifica TaxID=1114924 RepID=A0A1I3DDC1_9RHOB|nr:putative metalloprotease CJM1_0395 family protein [Albimonas pacifica]SFH84762.1 SprA-related family protein [Albimonas pacifica]